jgi:hypothetical protein
MREELAAIRGDLSPIMRRLMQMDENLDRIIWLLDEEGDGDEAAPEDDA